MIDLCMELCCVGNQGKFRGAKKDATIVDGICTVYAKDAQCCRGRSGGLLIYLAIY